MESVCGDGAPHAGTVVEERVRSVLRFFAGAKSTHKDADRRGPGGDRKAPWLLRHRQANFIRLLQKNTPEILRDFRVMGQGPNKTTCIRRFPKGDRKALWSPVRAKPHLAQRHSPKGKSHIQTIPQALGLGVMGQGPMALAGVLGAAPPIGVRGKAPLKGQGPMALAGVLGAAPPTGIPKGKALWRGCRGRRPCRGVGQSPTKGVQGRSP